MMIKKLSFEETSIGGLYKVTPFYADDARGSFIKDYSEEIFLSNGVGYPIREVFYTNSFKGTVRAMHFQRVKQQPKLVRCIRGHVFDVVVDLRVESPTFKKWLAFDLDDRNNIELLIPSRCAHGYLVLEDSIVSYKCAEKFYAEYDDGIIWNDRDIGIEWPLGLIGGAEKVILSEKDMKLQSFCEFMERYDDF